MDLALARYLEQLLDLSVRNPLLHFVTRDAKGKLKPKRLELQTPALDESYRLLVIEGHGVVFEGSRDAVPEDDGDLPGFSHLGAGGARKGDLKVQVTLTALNLQKRLVQMARTSREFVEEQDVQCLYLGLRQLHGFEDRKTASDPLAPRLAPLILHPNVVAQLGGSGGVADGSLTLDKPSAESNINLNLKVANAAFMDVLLDALPENDEVGQPLFDPALTSLLHCRVLPRRRHGLGLTP
ncbi:DUF4011 domain-containing protein [Deinococcus rubellus]|uniref:DUF4011 domain-containing protein n=1 Tax=Deinococcus rubellus TaxID=1889240 RepID=UPI0031F16BDE